MNNEELNLIKQAVTMISCDFDARVKLINAVQAVEAKLAHYDLLLGKQSTDPKPENTQ